MKVQTLRVAHVRSVASASLEPGPHHNLIVGPNGAGKTSLLEALHIVAYARSFRTRMIDSVVAIGDSVCQVFVELLDDAGMAHQLGIEKGPQSSRSKLDGEPVRSSSTLARIMPLLVMAPDDLKVVWEGAENRRRLLDWTLFHVEHRYLSAYQRYQRCLKQRNAALKAVRQSAAGGGSALDQWDEQLVDAGERLDALRRSHLPAITNEMAALIESLLGETLECVYEPGWPSAESLSDALSSRRGLDIVRGYTSMGPHRSDLLAQRRGRPAKETLSRGQGRLLVFAMHIAQVRTVVDIAQVRPVLLLDDVGSELDEPNFGRIFAVLDEMDIQTFVTAVPNEVITRIAEQRDRVKVFHVEQGTVSEVL